ncbi:hypothetical protein GCM10008174_22570 [Methylopila turkensis]|uniref:Uncharacterized protein n=1 Tax=Methylopila turkensis TaxID=1437816 RepID=A0A9W6N7M2_9HYPH|nr:hypothetical protein GCM10008174_22570 [Methylopila turkensis]
MPANAVARDAHAMAQQTSVVGGGEGVVAGRGDQIEADPVGSPVGRALEPANEETAEVGGVRQCDVGQRISPLMSTFARRLIPEGEQMRSPPERAGVVSVWTKRPARRDFGTDPY